MKSVNCPISIFKLIVITLTLFLTTCASRQLSTVEQLGRYIEANPEIIWNASINVLGRRHFQIVSQNQNDPKSWIIETAMKGMKTRQMRDYAISQYGYKPNYITYVRTRYKIKIVVEPISATSCSVAIKFLPQLLASGTSDYAGNWEDAKSIGVFEEELLDSILVQASVPKP